MNQDLYHVIKTQSCIPADSVADNTAEVGAIIDGADFNSLTYIINIGDIADASAEFTVLLEESDDSGMSGATAVADADMLGTEAGCSFDETSDDDTAKLGYVGSKRYTRMTITPTNNATACFFGVVAVLAHPRKGPQSTQTITS